MGRGQDIKTDRIWKRLILTLMDDSGVEDFTGGSNCRCGGKAREIELEAEPKDVTELLQSPGNNVMNEELLLMDEQRKWFLEMQCTPDEDAV